MQGKKISMKGTSTGTVALNDEVFATKAHPQTINDVVKAQLNNQRQGTNSTKTRAEVAGGGRKPWRQKGTGRARAGSTTSPLWPGGGCTFGPHQQVYDIRPPKKMVDRAIIGVIAELAAHEHVVVVEGLGFESGKTRDVRTFLAGLKVAKALLVVPEITENTRRAVANMREVKIVTPTQVNAVDLLKFGHLAIHDQAVKLLEEVLSK